LYPENFLQAAFPVEERLGGMELCRLSKIVDNYRTLAYSMAYGVIGTNVGAWPLKGTGFNCGAFKKNIEYGFTEKDPLAREVMTMGRTLAGRSDSLRQQIYVDLRGKLQRGEIGPEERLIDVAIAEAMGVSRMPVREALLQLMNEGYLVGTTRGFALPKLTLEDVNDIFEVRKLLEPRAAANAARDLAEQEHVRLKEALSRARQAVASQDVIELALANVSFRETWLSGVRNQRLAATISRFVDHVQYVRFGTLHDPNVRPVVMEGLEGLYDAFIRRDAIAAHDRMAAFIAESEKSFFIKYRNKPVSADEPDRRIITA
jgi:DNA-binding GntR family transcriptional regulator